MHQFIVEAIIRPTESNHLRPFFIKEGLGVCTFAPPPLAGTCANLSENALDFPPPFQGEGRGGDGVDCVISASSQHFPHPHPNLPLEGEGTINSKFALMPLAQGGGISVFKPPAPLIKASLNMLRFYQILRLKHILPCLPTYSQLHLMP